MSKLAKALSGAAGNAGGDKLYVEDVFSTYVYTGTGAAQTIQNGINLGSSLGGPSTNFVSGQNLSRASNLTGNAQTKQMTFSCWIFWEGPNGGTIFYLAGTYVRAEINSDGSLSFLGYAAGAADTLQMQTPAGTIPLNSWTNILFSFDLASTSNRYLYINDVAVTPTYTHYVNQLFNNDAASQSGPSPSSSTSYAHLLVDYNYIDLSVTSNRRNFITADLQPAAQATQEALNPIIYLPMTTSTPGTNAGTGGDFTATNSPVFNETFGPADSSEAGEGGLLWLKARITGDNYLIDTQRGGSEFLISNTTSASATVDTYPVGNGTAFNSNGFSIGPGGAVNGNTNDFVSWSFRKAEKFFDVVTWTGDGTAGPFTLSHNLGATVGMSVVKVTSHSGDWITNHRSLPSNYLALNSTAAAQTDVTMTSTDSTITFNGSNVYYNFSGRTYVAYLFASEAGGYGDDGTENIIKCGSFNSTALTNLGWEPQWVMMKRIDSTSGWFMMDNMRGMTASTNTTTYNGTSQYLYANTSAAEAAATGVIAPAATGFGSGQSGTYIYIAIRRPMKTPTAGTEVFAIDTPSSTAAGDILTSGFVDDTIFQKYRTVTSGFNTASRLTGIGVLTLSSTNDENTNQDRYGFDVQDGVELIIGDGSYPMLYYHFRRAAGFFDVLCYTGNGGRRTPALTHNLGVVPELVIVKSRSSTGNWFTLSTSLGQFGFLNNGDGLSTTDIQYAFGDGTNYVAPTSTALQVDSSINGNTQTFVAYLFATVAGVSKVGTYTGTGTTHNIDCGFTGGARFVMIKRADGSTNTGDWYVWDSLRGIVAGNDPYLLLNSTAVEVTNTDYIDPLNAGFTITSGAPAALNYNNGTFIFLAIA